MPIPENVEIIIIILHYVQVTDLMKAFDYIFVVLRVAFNHPRHRIREPLLELPMGLEHMRHQEVHQRPELHQIVLERCSCQKQPSVEDT